MARVFDGAGRSPQLNNELRTVHRCMYF